MMTKNQHMAIFFLIGLSLISISCGLFGNLTNETENLIEEIDIPTIDSSELEENVETLPETIVEEENDSGGNLEGMEIDEEELPFPIVEDAYNFEDFLGTYTYLTNMPVEEVADFYRTEMVAAGFEITADVATSNGTIFNFTKEGILVTMNVLENEDGSVLVRYVDASP